MSLLNLSGVFDALAAQPRKSPGTGRAIMFIAARRGDGVSTIAKAAAETAGPGAVYAIDLDLQRNALARAFAADEAPLGPKIDGALAGASFYSLVTSDGRTMPETAPVFSYHRVGRTRTYVGAFDGRLVPAGGRVYVSAMPDYWHAARAGGATAIVDAPALERSHVGLRIAAHMDGVVLVVGSDAGSAPAALAATRALAERRRQSHRPCVRERERAGDGDG